MNRSRPLIVPASMLTTFTSSERWEKAVFPLQISFVFALFFHTEMSHIITFQYQSKITNNDLNLLELNMRLVRLKGQCYVFSIS